MTIRCSFRNILYEATLKLIPTSLTLTTSISPSHSSSVRLFLRDALLNILRPSERQPPARLDVCVKSASFNSSNLCVTHTAVTLSFGIFSFFVARFFNTFLTAFNTLHVDRLRPKKSSIHLTTMFLGPRPVAALVNSLFLSSR